MKKAQFVSVTSMFGFKIDLPFDGDNYYCLVCGENWHNASPWDLNGSITCEYCPICGVQFGVTDMPRSNEGQTHAQRIDELRIDWLNKTGWQEADLEQLERVLGIVLDRPEAPE